MKGSPKGRNKDRMKGESLNWPLYGALIVGLAALAWGLLHHAKKKPAAGQSAPPPPAQRSERQPLYWYDPMVPEHHFDAPGKSPFMDMQLVPKYADEDAGTAKPGSIAIDPRLVQNLGVRLARVEESAFARVVDTVGLVGVDEHRIEAIQVRAAGWVETLEVRAVGDAVHRGQKLAGVYSPDLLAAQEEMLIARGSRDAVLIAATQRRLALLGLAPGDIAQLEKTGRAERRVNYYAPFDGYVMELGARQGAAVAPEAMLFQLADLSQVWITAEVPEAQAAWIKPGDAAQVELAALPGARFDARIDYLYPELATATRTLKVRIVVDNPGGKLRPGMFATAHLQGAPRDQVLSVPTEAVIKTGARSVVIVADDTRHFRPVRVQVGEEYGGRSEILEGLSLGETVVASGQFLIDSEANLRGAFESLTGAGDKPASAPVLMPAPSATPAPELK